MHPPRILIVEDEESIRDMLIFALKSSNFEVREAKNVKAAREEINQHRPDLILLDWMLPGMSGIDFAAELKKDSYTSNIRIIMLTARAEEENKIKGLETGADDYITKPFSPRELIARVKTILRRSVVVTPEGIIANGNLILNTQTHCLSIEGNELMLSAIEYKLFYFFMSHPNRIYTREQLLENVWPNQSEINERTVDVQIKRLRTLLAPYHYDSAIQTVRGYGYQFVGKRNET